MAARPYKVICVSTYVSDLETLDAQVAELKRRGWRSANRSRLIRLALSRVDLDEVLSRVGVAADA